MSTVTDSDCLVVNNTWYPLQAALALYYTTCASRQIHRDCIVSTVPTTLNTTRIIVHRINLSGSSESTVLVSCSQDQDVKFQRVFCGCFLFTGSGCEVSAGLLWSFFTHRIRIWGFSGPDVVLAGLLCSQDQDVRLQKVCCGRYVHKNRIWCSSGSIVADIWLQNSQVIFRLR